MPCDVPGDQLGWVRPPLPGTFERSVGCTIGAPAWVRVRRGWKIQPNSAKQELPAIFREISDLTAAASLGERLCRLRFLRVLLWKVRLPGSKGIACYAAVRSVISRKMICRVEEPGRPREFHTLGNRGFKSRPCFQTHERRHGPLHHNGKQDSREYLVSARRCYNCRHDSRAPHASKREIFGYVGEWPNPPACKADHNRAHVRIVAVSTSSVAD